MMIPFCFAMGKYFTVLRVIAVLREMEIGIFGTARYRSKIWSPNER